MVLIRIRSVLTVDGINTRVQNESNIMYARGTIPYHRENAEPFKEIFSTNAHRFRWGRIVEMIRGGFVANPI